MADQENNWRTLDSTTVYDNPWIRVEDHRVINPAGKESQYGKVCFKNRAVAIAAFDAAGSIFLVGQHRYTLGEYSWELPMGGAPFAEDPLHAAQRELREECGLVGGRWRELMRLHTSNCITDELAIVYVTEELTLGERAPEETEDLCVRLLPFSEALEWALDGRITDAISVAALLKLARERNVGERA